MLKHTSPETGRSSSEVPVTLVTAPYSEQRPSLSEVATRDVMRAMNRHQTPTLAVVTQSLGDFTTWRRGKSRGVPEVGLRAQQNETDVAKPEHEKGSTNGLAMSTLDIPISASFL